MISNTNVIVKAPHMSVRNMSNLNIIGDVEITKKLGEGSFGVVYLGMWHGAPVAAKKLKGEEEWKAFQREAELLE